MIQIRNNCFETNSSSSHSVCISMDNEIDQSLNELIKDNKLYIYPRNDGFSNFKTNKCLDKLQFLVSLVCNDVSTVQGSKKVKHLRTLLKNAIGVNEVYIGHVDEYYMKLRQRNKKPFNDALEHQVFLMENFKLPKLFMVYEKTLHEEIFETRETLRSFIVSPNSWLYVPSDSSSSKYKNLSGVGLSQIEEFECEKYYVSKETDSIVSINYTPDLRADIEVSLNDNNMYYSMDSSLKHILQIYDKFALSKYVQLKDNELVYCDSCDRILVEVIGDKYFLIQVFKKKNLTELDETLSTGRNIKHGDKYELPRFKGIPEDAEECKTYRIDIRSDKFFGDLIL